MDTKAQNPDIEERLAKLEADVGRLQHCCERLEKFAGTLALSADHPVCLLHKIPGHSGNLLDHVDLDTDDGRFMLAAFCLDLGRKMEYLFMAAKDLAAHAHPATTARIHAHNEDLKTAFGTSNWQALARRADEILHELDAEIAQQYTDAMKGVVP